MLHAALQREILGNSVAMSDAMHPHFRALKAKAHKELARLGAEVSRACHAASVLFSPICIEYTVHIY